MAGPADCATSSSSTGANPFDAIRSPSPVGRSSVDESIPPARATASRPKGFDPGCADAALACGEGAPQVGVAGPGSPAQGRGGNDSNHKGREAASRGDPAPAREHIRPGRAKVNTILIGFCRPSGSQLAEAGAHGHYKARLRSQSADARLLDSVEERL